MSKVAVPGRRVDKKLVQPTSLIAPEAKAPVSVGLRVGVLGTPVSSGNRGVQALGASLVNLCAGRASQCEVTLFLGHADNRPAVFRIAGQRRDVAIVNCRLSPRARPRDHLAWILTACCLYRVLRWRALRRWLSRNTPWIAGLERMDVVGDIRGGDSFSDIYGLGRFLYGFLMAWTVVLVKGGLVQFPQTFGPYRHALARWLARYLLRRAPVVIARDTESQRVARGLVGPARDVWLSPDVAFALEAVAPERIELWPAADEAEDLASARVAAVAKPVAININGLMYNGGYTRDNMFGLKLDYAAMLPELLRRLLELHPGDLWLIPHTYGPPESVESDPEACRRVRLALPEPLRARVRVLVGEYDCHEIKGVIGQCDFFVGSRMHACIAALSQGIPTVGIAYSRKFRGVFESVGMADWVVDGREVDAGLAIERVQELYRKRDAVRADLTQAAAQARQRLAVVFGNLVAGMPG